MSRSEAQCCDGLDFTYGVSLRWLWKRWTNSYSHICRLVLFPEQWIRQLGLCAEWFTYTEPSEYPSKITRFHLAAMKWLRHDAKVAAETCSWDFSGKAGPPQSAAGKADDGAAPFSTEWYLTEISSAQFLCTTYTKKKKSLQDPVFSKRYITWISRA